MTRKGDLRGIDGFHDILTANFAWNWWFLRSESVVELTYIPNGARTCDLHVTGSSLLGSYRVAYTKQLIMQTVHIIQLDSAGTDSLPKGRFFARQRKS
jgi:hypothetical protein